MKKALKIILSVLLFLQALVIFTACQTKDIAVPESGKSGQTENLTENQTEEIKLFLPSIVEKSFFENEILANITDEKNLAQIKTYYHLQSRSASGSDVSVYMLDPKMSKREKNILLEYITTYTDLTGSDIVQMYTDYGIPYDEICLEFNITVTNDGDRIYEVMEDYVFIPDEKAFGTWEAFDNVYNIDAFDPEKQHSTLHERRILKFFEEGKIKAETDAVNISTEWTKGYILYASLDYISKYTIKNIGGTDYMFVEDKFINGQDYYVYKKTAVAKARERFLPEFDCGWTEITMEKFFDSENIPYKIYKKIKYDDIIKNLNMGNIIIIGIDLEYLKAWNYTSGGHWIIIKGKRSFDGIEYFQVHDPAMNPDCLYPCDEVMQASKSQYGICVVVKQNEKISDYLDPEVTLKPYKNPEYIKIKDDIYPTNREMITLSEKELETEDIEPIKEMTDLTYLNLMNNNIRDISALEKLTNLSYLYLKENLFDKHSRMSFTICFSAAI